MGERGLLGGRYELGEALGSGGFATVFAARDRLRDLDVAVKLVPPPLGGGSHDALGERLRREIDVLRRLSSRYIAQVLDWGSDEHGVWLVMERVVGVPLTPEALGRPLFPHEVLRVARGLLEGLSVAHAAGIVHGDVKPSNVLVPHGRDALDAPKLIDFGLARPVPRAAVARDLGGAGPTELLGTARYMAPELLRGAEASRASDVYAAGLVLFELLGEGALFPGETLGDRLRARLTRDPELAPRVPPPLSTVLSRMLASDPVRRYRNASQALDAVVDLDTAPVSVPPDDAPPSSKGPSRPSFHVGSSVAPTRVSSPALSRPPPAPSVRPPAAPPMRSTPPSSRASTSPPSVAPSRPNPRLTTLSPVAVDGLRDTLRHLDLAMLDALARRERANVVGRIARACGLALRLELDAAALVIEPLGTQSDVARGVGAALLGPRARRVTRARVDTDRDDTWLDTVPAELAALLVGLGAALGAPEDAVRDAARVDRVLARLDRALAEATLDAGARRRMEAARVTLRTAHVGARVRGGDVASAESLAVLEQGGAPLDRLVRALSIASASFHVDDARARDELEVALKIAVESGATLLEARAATALGALLVEVPTRASQALAVLERASTLLAHGDAPSLEHEAEHHRAAALVVSGRFDEAVQHLRAAREAAHAERAVDREVSSASLEIVTLLAVGDRVPAREAAAALGDARIGRTSGRAAAFAWMARSLDMLVAGERGPAEDALAEARARAREPERGPSDAYVLVEVLALLFDAARGQLPDVVGAASELERIAQEHGFSACYWFSVLHAVIERVDGPERAPMSDALARLTLLFGPSSRVARERRTSAPPPA